ASLSSYWMMANLTPLFQISVVRPFLKPVSHEKAGAAEFPSLRFCSIGFFSIHHIMHFPFA
ncbi:MAG: hypothetical protein ACI4JQ_07205, partial [Ruminococcus sp.]